MTGILYKLVGEKNRLDKTSYLTNATNITGVVIKFPSSIIDPILTLNGTAIANLWQFNYIRLDEFDRYYFIDDIISIANNLWEVHCHVDVLMSWKDEIVDNTCRVMRNEFRGNNFIVDDMAEYLPYYKVRKTFDYEPVTFKQTLFEQAHNKNDCAFVVCVRVDSVGTTPGNNSEQNTYEVSVPNDAISVLQGTNLNYYITNEANILKFLSFIDNDSQAASYVNGVWVYPFKFAEVGDSTARPDLVWETIMPNGIDTEAQGFRVGAGFSIDGNAPVSLYQALNADFTLITGTAISIWLPFYGFYDLNISKFISLIQSFDEHFNLDIRYYIDLVTHSITYIISYQTYDTETDRYRYICIDRLNVPCGVGVEFNIDNADQVERNRTADSIRLVGNIIGSVAGIGGSAASGYVGGALVRQNAGRAIGAMAGAIGGATQAIGGILKSASDFFANRVVDVPYGSTVSNNGETYSWFYYNTYDILVSVAVRDLAHDRDDNYKHLCGMPCDIIDTLSNMHGYTIVSDIHLDNVPALSRELDEIIELLQSGILMPNE